MGWVAAFAFGHFRISAMRIMAFLACWYGLVRLVTKSACVFGVFAFILGKLFTLLRMAADTTLLGRCRELYRGYRHVRYGVAMETS